MAEGGSGRALLSLPLAALTSVRLLPPYRPILELRTESSRWLLILDGEEDLLSWMGLLLVLLPTFKPREDLEPPASNSAKRSAKEEPKAKRLSHAVGMAAATHRREHRTQARSFSAGEGNGRRGSAKRTSSGLEDEEEKLLVVGAVKVFTERNGVHRWVACHARLDSDGLLTILSLEAWSLRLSLIVREATHLLRLGTSRWAYLRLQVSE